MKYFRKINTISQKKFGTKMRLMLQRVGEGESGKAEPSLYNVIKILNLFNITLFNITFEKRIEGVEAYWV